MQCMQPTDTCLFFKTNYRHGCLVSPTQVMREGTCSQLPTSSRNSSWTAGFFTYYKYLSFAGPTEHPLSKKHIVPSVERKVLWESYGLSKWYGCRNISKNPWVYRVWLVYTRNSGLVIHSYTVLMTLNNLLPDGLKRDCYFLYHI